MFTIIQLPQHDTLQRTCALVRIAAVCTIKNSHFEIISFDSFDSCSQDMHTVFQHRE